VRMRFARAVSGGNRIGDHERRDGRVGVPTLRLVEGDEENAALPPGRRCEQSRHPRREPSIAVCDRAIVHVVAQIGHDELELGDPGVECFERDDLRASLGGRLDPDEADRRVVLAGVGARPIRTIIGEPAGEAFGWNILGRDAPVQTLRLELVDEAEGSQVVVVVVVDPLPGSAEQRDVVRLRRME
jgi:hypothetical protein